MINDLIGRKALFVVNHSGGKDSQAMLIEVRKVVPADQILVIHADLPGVEWEGTEEHARRYADGLAYMVVRAKVTFLGEVERRHNWPSPKFRSCTSQLKQGPIEKAIRHYLKANGLSGLVVNCMGIRADESCQRAKRQDLVLNEKNSKAGREWYDWLPIFNMPTPQVFETIKLAGQEPHWAYGIGMSRLSCRFCIMASKKDLRISASANPAAFNEIAATEKRIGKTMFMEKGLPIGIEEYLKVK